MSPVAAMMPGENGLDAELLFELPINDLMEVDVMADDRPEPDAGVPENGEGGACDPPRPDCEPLDLWPEDLPDPGAGYRTS